jgi:hypothetical protein
MVAKNELGRMHYPTISLEEQRKATRNFGLVGIFAEIRIGSLPNTVQSIIKDKKLTAVTHNPLLTETQSLLHVSATSHIPAVYNCIWRKCTQYMRKVFLCKKLSGMNHIKFKLRDFVALANLKVVKLSALRIGRL